MHYNEFTDILFHPDGREVIVWKGQDKEWLDLGFVHDREAANMALIDGAATPKKGRAPKTA